MNMSQKIDIKGDVKMSKSDWEFFNCSEKHEVNYV